MNHFIACSWWTFAESSIMAYKDPNDTSGAYITAFYQSVLLMMGEKLELNSTPEKIFALVVIIFTSIFVAILFGEVAMIVSSFNANSQKYRRKMTELYEAMETMHLPITLQERVLQFYDFIWSKHHSLNGRTAMFEFMQEVSDRETELKLKLKTHSSARRSCHRTWPRKSKCSPTRRCS